MDKLKELLMNLIRSTLNSFDTMVYNAQGVLTGTGAASFNADSVWREVVNLSGVLKPFCYIVIVICFLIELAQVASKVDALKWEHGLKIGVKLVLSKVCIDVAPNFLRACYNQANIWINQAISYGNYQSLGSSLTSHIETAVGNVKGFWSILGLFISVFVVVLAVKVCGLLVQVIAYGRMFELFVYLAVSPLPCAFFPLGDGTGGGFSRITQKFFKSFIAVCLQGVMMILCIRIFYLIIGGAFVNMANSVVNSGMPADTIVSDLCFTMLMGAIVLVISISRCGSWAKSVIDAM